MIIREKNLIRKMAAFLLTVICVAGMSVQSHAQGRHSYPRIAVFHFGRNAPAYWYSKFDLVNIRSNKTSLVQAIRSFNPDAYIFGTHDWNSGTLFRPTADAYKTYFPDGSPVYIYGSTTDNFSLNFSDFCGKVNGLRYNEALPQAAVDNHDQRYFDGIATDGIWLKPREAEQKGSIDLDRNGVNDYDEHGTQWVNDRWKEGVDKVIREINRINDNRPLILNSGRFHEPEFYWTESNGMIMENTAFIPSVSVYKNRYEDWMKVAREPHLLIFDGMGYHKEDYVRMRYLLGMTLFGDGYFSYTDNDLHHYHYYYDEYDVDLGRPTTSMQLVRPNGSDERGVYVRFFTKGAVILNASESEQTVTDGDIRTNGYAGPYYRFRGNQNIAFNSGGQFTSVTLHGELDNRNRLQGDAILLTRQEVDVVADIVVDNDVRGTNPGSRPATFSGNWTRENESAKDCWALSYRGNRGDYAVDFAQPGSGEAAATFTPTIGLPGKYHVYEWHGRVDGYASATNVPYEIRHAGGRTTGTINQQQDEGRWNYIGEFNFGVGNNGYIRISNQANGIVLADAFMFVYNEAIAIDAEAPSPPTGLRVEQE